MDDTASPQSGLASTESALITSRIEACLRDFVTQRRLPDHLSDAVLYAGLGPGKRVRPQLAVRACEAVGGHLDSAGLISAATAIEMIHAFSLVHDDLPAMDDDDLRRGRPTLHVHTDEATAILAGDALTSLAFELLTTIAADSHNGVLLPVHLTRELSRATTDMIAGQVLDTFHEARAALGPNIPDIDRLVTTHRLKTGALLRAAVRIGGLCGHATPNQLDALTAYAEAIGLMFQITDDLLDVTGDADVIGKTPGKDAAAGKLTYPDLLGVEGAQAEVARLRDDALAALSSFTTAADPLRDMARTLADRHR